MDADAGFHRWAGFARILLLLEFAINQFCLAGSAFDGPSGIGAWIHWPCAWYFSANQNPVQLPLVEKYNAFLRVFILTTYNG